MVLLDNKLYAELEKCEFHSAEDGFLGFVMLRGGFSQTLQRSGPQIVWPTPYNEEAATTIPGICQLLPMIHP